MAPLQDLKLTSINELIRESVGRPDETKRIARITFEKYYRVQVLLSKKRAEEPEFIKISREKRNIFGFSKESNCKNMRYKIEPHNQPCGFTPHKIGLFPSMPQIDYSMTMHV